VDDAPSPQPTPDALAASPGHAWAARLAATLGAVLLALTIPVVYLFVDLLVARGLVPDYADLPAGKQEAFRQEWDHSLGANADIANVLAKVRPADTETKADPVQHWQWRWQAVTYQMLADRVGQEAADAYLELPSNGGQAVPTGRRLGVLSLLARERPRWTTTFLAPLARSAGWSWKPDENGTNTPYLGGLFVLLFLMTAGQIALAFAAGHWAAAAGLAAATRLRRSVFGHANRLNQVVVRPQTSEEVATLLTTRLEVLAEGLRTSLLYGWRLPVLVGLVLLILVSVNVGVALCFLFLAAVIWFAVGQFAAHFSRDGRLASRRAEARLSQMRESVSILQLVKCYLMDRFNQTRVERQLTDYSRAEWRRLRGEALSRPAVSAAAVLAGVGVLYLAGRAVLLGDMSVAGLAAKLFGIGVLIWAVGVWTRVAVRARRAAVARGEIAEFLNRRTDIGQTIDAEFLQPMERKLEILELSMREPGSGRMLLENVTINVPAGARVAVVASDPEESHTLAYLLTRFLDPTGGEIRIDGKNTRWVTHESLRTQVAMVMQQNLTFSDTVANNIGCGDPGYTLPQVIEAGKMAHAHQFVQRLPYGYETLIGDGGVVLRPGEKLRVALARAVLRDPSVIVVEEPELPMDEDSRVLLDDAYERLAGTRTLLFFSRRQSVLRHADRVVILHRGRVVAAGSHEDLLRTNDLYRHLLFKEITVPTAA
jgi:ABC-type multidrug transport system fused ATPase/permease subunit